MTRNQTTPADEAIRTPQFDDADHLYVGNRVKGLTAGTIDTTFPVNKGTVVNTDIDNALVDWDTGEKLWHRQAELKRI